MKVRLGMALCLGLMLTACNDGGSTDESVSSTPQADEGDWYRPTPGTAWQWQLSGTVNVAYDAMIYDVDLFDAPQSLIDQLHGAGRKVICYFSAGSYEAWREDAGRFPAADLGNPLDGWAGERWLDIRSDAVRAIMTSRLDLAVQKGCDGVEPDNVDGYTNTSGFPLAAGDQLAFNRFLAYEAHIRSLSIGLKNDLEQVPELVAHFDFAVNEQCHAFDECDALAPFINAGKAVLNAEYDVADPAALCAAAERRRFSTLILPLDLDDSSRHSCL